MRSHLPTPRSALSRSLAVAALLLLVPACGAAGLDDEEADGLNDRNDPGVEVTAQSEPAGYYDSARNKTGATLLAALRARIAGHTSLSYSAARNTMFGSIADPDNDNVVGCIYTGRSAPNITDSGSAGGASMNTEHTWPQSLGATGTAQTDLHHLFPTDSTSNSRRGNLPFGEVKTVTWTAPNLDGGDGSRLGTDAAGRTTFEPQSRVKGDIARALLYFYTRYAGAPPSKFSTTNFTVEQATLLRWHQQDPPDAAERLHNDAVYGVQRNRNPYIDHPEYVNAIGTFK